MNQYHAFISYSHTDCKDIAAPIQKALQNIGKPWYKELSTNLKIYRDQTDLTATPGFWPKIEAALKDAEYFILLASPKAAESGWIKDEINVWINKCYSNEEGLINLFIVLCDGNIEWNKEKNDFDHSKTNCLPKELYGKFKNEPLWIDLRSYIENQESNRIIRYKDFGFSEQVAKVIGGIIDKPPSEIISKELQRVVRLRNIYIATGITLLILLGIAVMLFVGQRKTNNELNTEKLRSDSLRIQAVRERDVARQNLIRFKVEEFNRNVRNANIYIEAREYTLATQVLNNAKATIEDTLYTNIPDIVKDKARVAEMIDLCKKNKNMER